MHPPELSANTGCERAREAIERFLAVSRNPKLFEPGEPPYTISRDNFRVEWRGTRLTVQVWDERRNLVRRVTGVEEDKPGKLELVIERFGKRPGRLTLLDTALAVASLTIRRAARRSFLEQLRCSLQRQFPGWRVSGISTEPDLEHSLSPSYPRALIRRGTAGWAALGVPADGPDPSAGLAFGLLWLDYLRRREPRITIEGLVLLLPAKARLTTCLRLRHVNPQAGRFVILAYSDEGLEEVLDERDWGNLETRLDPCHDHERKDGEAGGWAERLEALRGVESVRRPDGGRSLRVNGLEFARYSDGRLVFGIETTRPASASNLAEIEGMAAELARLRSAVSPDRQNPLYQRCPEAWLETQVRAHIEDIDARLEPEPVYGQVPAFAGGERGVLDLLCRDRSGRLAVLELKASQDLQLPLQALDYWMRVAWHAERDEFASQGYFPGSGLSKQPPRLLLVAPALEFHPTTETLLRFLSPSIEVERIGLGVEWRKKPSVMFRIPGARAPI